MKNLINAAVLLVALSAALMLAPGCQCTPQRAAYNTVAGVEVSVDVAMQAWGDYVSQFQPSASQEAAVKAAFEKYQAIEQVAIDAAQFYATLAARSDPGTAAAQAQKDAAMAQAAASLGDLVNLLRSFGVKL
jgi:hypothetical protein